MRRSNPINYSLYLRNSLGFHTIKMQNTCHVATRWLRHGRAVILWNQSIDELYFAIHTIFTVRDLLCADVVYYWSMLPVKFRFNGARITISMPHYQYNKPECDAPIRQQLLPPPTSIYYGICCSQYDNKAIHSNSPSKGDVYYQSARSGMFKNIDLLPKEWQI